MMAITLENPAFIGSVVICLIFGVKKIKDVPKTIIKMIANPNLVNTQLT
ncbi:MAG: hypothetical protein Q4D68_04320 [Moraxella equi]|nr:hypothetical protein [Moraxella equi]